MAQPVCTCASRTGFVSCKTPRARRILAAREPEAPVGRPRTPIEVDESGALPATGAHTWSRPSYRAQCLNLAREELRLGLGRQPRAGQHICLAASALALPSDVEGGAKCIRRRSIRVWVKNEADH